MQIGAKLPHNIDVRQIGRIIYERAQEYLMLLNQVLEQMVRANFVTLIGRIGQPVHQVKQLAHGMRRSGEVAHNERP
jgi:hypothetical protein